MAIRLRGSLCQHFDTVGDTLTWQKGRHSLKFGMEYKHHPFVAARAILNEAKDL